MTFAVLGDHRADYVVHHVPQAKDMHGLTLDGHIKKILVEVYGPENAHSFVFLGGRRTSRKRNKRIG